MIIRKIDTRNQTTRSRTAGGFSGKKKRKTFISRYITSGSIFSLDTQTGTSLCMKNQK
jgi:hypothetical protein